LIFWHLHVFKFLDWVVCIIDVHLCSISGLVFGILVSFSWARFVLGKGLQRFSWRGLLLLKIRFLYFFWKLESFHLLFGYVYFILIELRRQKLIILQKITYLILFFIWILLSKRNILRVSYFELFLANWLSLSHYLCLRTEVTIVREITLRQGKLVC